MTLQKRRIPTGGRSTPEVESGRVNQIQRSDPDRDSILFGRPNRLKVFVSSEMRSRSLEKERYAVAEVADAHPDAEAWMWERSAHSGPYSSIEVCRGHAATSDLLMLIVSETLTYATEIEWRAAKEKGVSCAIFLKEGAKRDARLEAFLEVERHAAIYVQYRDIADLKSRVGETIRQSHTSAIRGGVLLRRRVEHLGSVGAPRLFEAGLDSAEQQLYSGSASVAAEMIAELENLFGDRAADKHEQLYLLSGQVHATLGDRARAIEAYERVVTHPGHTPVGAAIAKQNLGLEALKRRDFTEARELMRDSLGRHTECENWFGVLQCLLNFATLEEMEGKLEEASELADFAEQFMAEFDQPLPYQALSLQGLRGNIAAHAGRTSDALELFRRAWKRARRLGDRDASCIFGQNIGSAHADLKRPAIAAKWYRRALAIAKEADNVWRQGELYGALAKLAYSRGSHVSALEHLESARAFAAKSDDGCLVATLTADIGAILAFTRDPRASNELDRAADLLREVGATDWLYIVEKNRGELAREAGDRARAIASFRRALECANSDDTRRAVHEGLAFNYLDKPIEEAAAFDEFLLAADCATQAGAADKAWLLGTYAAYLSKAGCLPGAIKMFDYAIGVGQSVADAEVLFHLQNDRSLILIDLGDLVTAKDTFQGGVAWARARRKRPLELQALHNLGETQRRLGDLAGSRSSLKRAVKLSERLGDDASGRSALALLAITELAEGSIDTAERHAVEVRNAAQEARDKANEAAATGTLAGVEYARGNYHVAARIYMAAAKLNREDPVRHCEDLMGALEAGSAAGDWRRVRRIAQIVVDYAQEEGLQYMVWPSLLRAAKWYLDRGGDKNAGILAAPAIVLAQQSVENNKDLLPRVDSVNDGTANSEDDGEALIALGQLVRALMTLAFYVKLSSQGSASSVWTFLLDAVAPDSGQFRDFLRGLMSMVQESVAGDGS